MDASAGMARKSDANGRIASANGSSGTVSEEVVGGEKVGSEEMPSPSSSSSASVPSGSTAAGPGRQQVAVVLPRPAPSYRVVNAVIEKKEDGPGPRCGHTLTAVAAVGEEGSPGYVGPRLILFGGATALEGNSSVAGGPQAATPGAGIRKSSSCFFCFGFSSVCASFWSVFESR